MTGPDGLRDEIAAAIADHTERCSCCPTIDAPVKLANWLAPTVQAHIDAAAARADAAMAEAERLSQARIRANLRRDEATARAEAAEQAVRRVRAETAEQIAQVLFGFAQAHASSALGDAYARAASIAREHAKEGGDG